MTCTVQNVVGLVPLAWLLGCTTEDLALRCGPVAGGLINASFGNAPELILSIIALVRGLTTVALASLIGSVLSNLLLVLGECLAIVPLSAVWHNMYHMLANFSPLVHLASPTDLRAQIHPFVLHRVMFLHWWPASMERGLPVV